MRAPPRRRRAAPPPSAPPCALGLPERRRLAQLAQLDLVPEPRARVRGGGGPRRSQSLRGCWEAGPLSCLGASPFKPPPGLRRTSPCRRLGPAGPLWMPDSGFSASFRKGRFFSTPPRRKVWEHHPDCFLSQRWRAARGRIRRPGILLDDSREHSCLCPLSCQHAQVTAVGIGAGGIP